MSHTKASILATTQRLVAELLGLPVDEVTPEKAIPDLGADSIDEIELVMALEDEFGVEITDDDAEKCITPADAAALIARLLRVEA